MTQKVHKYILKWYNKNNPKIKGNGQSHDYSTVASWAKEMNNKYPTINHYVARK